MSAEEISVPDGVDLDEGQDAALESFSARLDELDATLSPAERAVLDTLLVRAMSPLERLRHREEMGLLDPDEQAMLTELVAEETGD